MSAHCSLCVDEYYPSKEYKFKLSDSEIQCNVKGDLNNLHTAFTHLHVNGQCCWYGKYPVTRDKYVKAGRMANYVQE